MDDGAEARTSECRRSGAGRDPLLRSQPANWTAHAGQNLRFWRAQDSAAWKKPLLPARIEPGSGSMSWPTRAGVARAFPGERRCGVQQPNAIILKDSPSSTVAELESVINGRRRRRFTSVSRHLLDRSFVALVRRTPALRCSSWVMACDWRAATPRPLASGTATAPACRTKAICYEKVPGLGTSCLRLRGWRMSDWHGPLLLRSVSMRGAAHQRAASAPPVASRLEAANILMSMHVVPGKVRAGTATRTAPEAREDDAGPANLLPAQPGSSISSESAGPEAHPRSTGPEPSPPQRKLRPATGAHATDRLRFLLSTSSGDYVDDC